MVRVMLRLEDDENDALVVLAERERRHPREQAALIIRVELERCGLLTNTPTGEARRVETPQLIKTEEAKK